jgi:hypothetical protein
VRFEDVFVFVWCHRPEFSQDATKSRRRVLRACWRHINPRFPALNELLLVVTSLPRWRWLRSLARPNAAQRMGEAVAEIRRIVSEATHDFPRGSDDAPAAQVAMQAQILNLMRRSLALSFAEVESMPLKRLVQHLRETIGATTGGKGMSLMHPDESAIWRQHLDQATARARAEKEAKANG